MFDSLPSQLRMIVFDIFGIALATPVVLLFGGITIPRAFLFAVGATFFARVWDYIYEPIWGQNAKGAWQSSKKGRITRFMNYLGFEVITFLMLVPMAQYLLGMTLITAVLCSSLMIFLYVLYWAVIGWAFHSEN
ncbi:hypothetical protein KFJ24_01345 [Marinobacter sediminum]|uniref:hypothetical protein n=1 Tax=Marinobacter sediminum TaxID=256323 RepID=UPI0020307E6E|nr:hypothetical protein [Marinobacter sediminum]MCM0611115.1 hypothetical protein [Marinobacter sediminum]